MSSWTNPCNGLRWRTLPDGAIEVEGQGVPMAEPGSKKFEYVEQTWRNWAPQFRQASKEYGIPVASLVAIATQETGPWAKDPERQRTILSGDGYGSIGITQPLASTATFLGFKPDDRFDPLDNIRMAAKLATKTAERHGSLDYPVLAAGHNAGALKCRPGQNRWAIHQYGDYLGDSLPYYNAAVRLLKVGRAGTIQYVGAAGLGALVGAGVAWALHEVL